MSHILFLSLVGPPDGVSTARLVGSLAAGLHSRGHAVTILTTSPHYNRDIGAEAKQPIVWRLGGLIGRSRLEGVDVVHVAMPRKGRVAVLRIMAWIWFHLISTIVGLFVLPRYDVIIAPSPPLTIGVSAWLLAVLRRSLFVYNVQEVYPDIAIQLGALKNAAFIRTLFWLERFVYGKADVVTVISAGIAKNLLHKGVPVEKVVEIPNFVDPLDLSHSGPPNPFTAKGSLDGKFVVTYAGNIGRAQGMEVLILAAEALRDESDFEFLIVGDGAAKADIEGLVRQKNLPNVRVLPYQPYEAMPHIYAASSVSVVLQSAGTGATATPSKAIQILGAGRPILAVTDPESDLAALVRATGSGLVVPPGQAEEVAAALREMRKGYETWQERARVARRSVLEAFSRVQVVEKYHLLLSRLAERN